MSLVAVPVLTATHAALVLSDFTNLAETHSASKSVVTERSSFRPVMMETPSMVTAAAVPARLRLVSTVLAAILAQRMSVPSPYLPPCN